MIPKYDLLVCSLPLQNGRKGQKVYWIHLFTFNISFHIFVITLTQIPIWNVMVYKYIFL